ncbi:MAG: WG repeat-containing protein, partial [Parapedobacter sp.]
LRGRLLHTLAVQHGYSFAEGLAPVEINGKWGYINRKGKQVIAPLFDWAKPFHENRAVISVGLKKGYINKNGLLVIPAIYEEAYPFKEGVAKVRYDQKWGLIDRLGNNLLPNDFYQISTWEKDFYRLESLGKTPNPTWHLGLADSKGQLLLDTLYTDIQLINNQYIRARKDNHVGLFDRRGKELIPMEYASLLYEFLNEDMVGALKNGKWGFLDPQGAVVHPFEFDNVISTFSEDRIWVDKDKALILLDTAFQIIKRFPNYLDGFNFTNGYAVVGIKDSSSDTHPVLTDSAGDLFGYIDVNGNEVIAPQYQRAEQVNPYGIAIVGAWENDITIWHLINMEGEDLSDGKRYLELRAFGSRLFYDSRGSFFSSKSGKQIVGFPYEHIQSIGTGLAMTRRNGKVGLIDTALSTLLPPEFDQIEDIISDRTKVQKDGLWGFADEKFRIRIPPLYDEVTHFFHPMATPVKKTGKAGVIDRYGRILIPFNYTYIAFDYSADLIYAKKSNGTDIYDKEGRLLLVTDFEHIGMFGHNHFAAYRQQGKVGFMDDEFHILRKPEFNDAGNFYDGLAWVKKGRKAGYINNLFQQIIPIQFDVAESFAKGFAKVSKNGREYYIDTKGAVFVPSADQIKEREAELKRRPEY